MLVMRARYRSGGLTPHQCGWTDAGWTGSRLLLCNGAAVNAAVSARLFVKKDGVFDTTCITCTCIPPASLSYARASMGYMELGSCYL